MPIVYIATNRINGKRYIGITTKTIAERMTRHFAQAKGNRKARFSVAIRKYGRDAFSWHELCRVETWHDAKAKEIELIATLMPEYNVTTGGDGAPGIVAWNRKPVICLNDGLVFHSGNAAVEYYKLHKGDVSVSCSRLSIVGGLHFAAYTNALTQQEREMEITSRLASRAKRRRTRQTPGPRGRVDQTIDSKGRSAAGPMSNARRVICLDDGRVFQSASSAVGHYDVPRSGIIELCLGKRGRKTIGGYRFSYMTNG